MHLSLCCQRIISSCTHLKRKVKAVLLLLGLKNCNQIKALFPKQQVPWISQVCCVKNWCFFIKNRHHTCTTTYFWVIIYRLSKKLFRVSFVDIIILFYKGLHAKNVRLKGDYLKHSLLEYWAGSTPCSIQPPTPSAQEITLWEKKAASSPPFYLF